MQKLDSSRPKPERMEETVEGGRGPPRAVAPLEEEEEYITKSIKSIYKYKIVSFKYTV